jgi:alkyldihydroxyacetonephosphate synthase
LRLDPGLLLAATRLAAAAARKPMQVPVSRLPAETLAALAEVVGVPNVQTDAGIRALHAGGKSYLDLLRRRAGDFADAPDAVVLPDTAEQVGALLSTCAAHDVAVVPFGGGTSVVGGVEPLRGSHRAVITLDLRRLDRLLEVDPVSGLATFEPGVRGPVAERLLAAHGLTLGHLPQSFEYATLGGFVATRSAGQASSGYGRIDELVVALTLQTPAGPWRLGRGAASAAGPDLRALAVGSEGTLGVLTELTVRVRPQPAHRHYEGRLVGSFPAGLDLLRTLAQGGQLPDVVRLSDPEETAVSLRMSAGGLTGQAVRGYARARAGASPCLLILGWEGTAPGIRARRRAARAALAGTVPLGRAAGEQWRRGRFDGPYLRDDLMDLGVLVETLETSASWSALPRVHQAIRAALDTALPGAVVMTHVSHLYPHGASLYVTVLAAADPAAPAAQWTAAKTAATDALVGAGATVTHHHATGVDHLPWMRAEIGALGVDVLRAVKGVLDPTGILNPGKLIPPVQERGQP